MDIRNSSRTQVATRHALVTLTALLLALRDGMTTDEALIQTYGFDIEGLEDAWRQAIGAKPRPAPSGASAQPTPQPTPTLVPTIVPVSGAPLTTQTTPTAVPTSAFNEQPTDVGPSGGPPLGLTLTLLGLCCAMLLLIGVVILGVIVSRQNRTGGNNVQ